MSSEVRRFTWAVRMHTYTRAYTHAKNTHAQILIVSRINISIVITSENGDGADHVVHNYCRKTMHVY